MPRVRTRPTRQDTNDRLIEGARIAFADKGFYGATVEDICTCAGLTRGAFYSSFQSKDDLFLAMYDHMVEEVAALIATASAETARHTDAPIEAFVHFIAHHYPLGREWFLLNAEFTLYAIRNPQVRQRFVDHRRALRTTIVAATDATLASAGRRMTIDPNLYARMLVGMYDSGLGQSLIEPDALEKGAFIDAFLVDLILSSSTAVEPTR